jgi:hypothetical protein
MAEYLGSIGKLSLFAVGNYSVVVDTELNMITQFGALSNIQKSGWSPESFVPDSAYELASAALYDVANPIVASASRMYTIPDGVKNEAIKALKWRKEHKRGGTPVGLNTARTLAKGGQIGITKVRHIAKYFPRHEVDKKGKGWDMGEDGFPSNGKIAWALWGGDAGQRWASAIVERENKKPVTAGGYNMPGYDDHLDMYDDNYDSDVNAFEAANDLDAMYGPEFLVRVCLDGSGIDRLYKIEIDGHVYVWDDCSWDDLGYVDGDIYAYDSALDDPYDNIEKTHVMVDPSSAIVISALMQETPYRKIQLEDIDSNEAAMFADSMGDLDVDFLDRVIVAAGISDTKMEDGDADTTPARVMPVIKPISTKGILGQPKVETVSAKAVLSEGPAALTRQEIEKMFIEWATSIVEARQKNGIVAAAEEATEEPMTPKTSDVEPKYIAIVSPDDPQAVMDVAAIVPKTATTTNPVVYKRNDKKWVLDEQILLDLQSATPPPVVKLDTKELINDILKQVDGIEEPATEEEKAPSKVPTPASAPEPTAASAYSHLINFWSGTTEALAAAGGLDRNRGNAEELRRYWTRGVGGAKIMWGTPGDWTRCVRQLSKYMGPRAKGYCQLRHKDMTGVYTGSKFNAGKERNLGGNFSSEDTLIESVINKSYLVASAGAAKERISGLTAGANSMTGSKFSIPLLLPEDLESGDGRKFKKDAVQFRDLPLPLLWQIKTADGHSGSVVVGRIDYMEKIPNGIGNAYGVFDTGAYGREAERLVRNGFIRGVSADLDQFEAKEHKGENASDDELGKQKLTINHARVMAATIVAKPAFQECTISVDETYSNDQEDQVIPADGIYEESVDSFVAAEALIASGFLDSEIPVTPPRQWFENPGLTKPTPITVDPSGRIYGHIAAWHVNHIGMPRSTRPPRSKSNYSYFHTGVVRTDAGNDIPVGQLTLAGGHAPLQADAVSAAKHYDDTASAIADVHAGEDQYGIWVAGSLRPDASEMQIRALRASAPSGDWRPINGSLELVAVCQVNVPGFPIARAMVASGKVMALVAAGASYFAIMKSQHVATLVDRAAKFNELNAASSDLITRFETQFGYVPREKREALAKEGKAMKDGSFPISNVEDLKNAIQAHGRAKDIAAAKKHIVKRARALGKYDLVPDEWKKPKTVAASAALENIRERALVASAVAELAKISEDERTALADKGQALPDGSFPIRNVDDLKNAIKAFNRAKEEDRPRARRHIMKRARQLKAADLVPDQWKNAHSMQAGTNLDRMRSVIASISSEFALPVVEEASDEELRKLEEAKTEADKETAEEIKVAEDIAAGKTTAEDQYGEDGRTKYTPSTQPRDARGKYRKVLARLRQDLGVAGLQKALSKVEEAENLDFAGNYAKSASASAELLDMIDRLDTGALNAKSLENVQNSARELGRVISNLPLPFGAEAEKLRFSDLPSGLKDLIDGMISRVESKIGKEDADIATAELKSYMSGADVYSQGQIQSQMSKLLRLLT